MGKCGQDLKADWKCYRPAELRSNEKEVKL